MSPPELPSAANLIWRPSLLPPKAPLPALDSLRLQHRSLTVAIRRSAKEDKVRFVTTLATEAQEAAFAGDFGALYKCVRRLRPFQPSKAQAVSLKDGTVAASPQACRTRWMEHFAETLKGCPTSFASLAREAAEASARGFAALAIGGQASLHLAPTLQFLTRRHASRNPARADGEDSIPALAYKVSPGVSAAKLFPVTLKSVLRLEEPTGWRGGFVCELWQGKISHLLCSSYRDVVIEDTCCKDLHSYLRGQVLGPLESYASPTQCGGIARRGTDFAMHFSREHWRHAHCHKLCAAQIYVDLVSAFASAARELVFTQSRTPAAVAAMMHKFEMPPDSMESFAAFVQSPDALQRAAVGAHLRALVQQAHEATWITVQGIPWPASTSSGSKAGDPLGDVFFIFLMTRIVHEIEARLASEDLLYRLPCHPGPFGHALDSTSDPLAVVSQVSYMDDLLLAATDPSPAGILAKAKRTASVAFSVIVAHGMRPNFSKGKSEVAFWVSGLGVSAFRSEVFLLGTIGIPVEGRGIVPLCVTRTYKHMGAVVTPELRMLPELKSRASSTRAAFLQLRTQLFTAGALTHKVKASLSDSLLLSRLFYGAESWQELTGPEAHLITATLVAIDRAILRMSNVGMVPELRTTDAQVQAASGRPALRTYLRGRRLLYLRRFLRLAPQPLWRLSSPTKGTLPAGLMP